MDQLELFAGGRPRIGVRDRDRQPGDAGPYTGGLAHLQFAYDSCPAVFGGRAGWGPLWVALDTNVLIDLITAFEQIESSLGITPSHLTLTHASRRGRLAALRDLFVLWNWRDVRFVTPAGYSADSKRRPLPDREVMRRLKVFDILGEDLVARGGLERFGCGWNGEDRAPRAWDVADDHDREIGKRADTRIRAMLPGMDGKLVAEAAAVGCHVFLTEDHGVLRRAEEIRCVTRLTATRTSALLDELAAAGELVEAKMSNGGLSPDLKSLSTFYALGSLADDDHPSGNDR